MKKNISVVQNHCVTTNLFVIQGNLGVCYGLLGFCLFVAGAVFVCCCFWSFNVFSSLPLVILVSLNFSLISCAVVIGTVYKAHTNK